MRITSPNVCHSLIPAAVMKCCRDYGSAKATDVSAAEYAKATRRRRRRVGPRTVNTGSSLILAEEPLPARNASYTYETCGALGQVCKGNRTRASQNGKARLFHSPGGVFFFVWFVSTQSASPSRRVTRREPSRAEPSLGGEREARIAECRRQ